MKNTLNEHIGHHKERRRRARRYLAVLLVLALITTLGVNWRLHATGIAMTADYECGREEHTHTEECYTRVLTCGLEEAEAAGGHIHGTDCYDEEGALICGLEETEASEGHVHTEGCYARELTCGMEEHEHTASCLSQTDADRETAETWEKTLPDDLTQDWSGNLVKVAESQLGYAESTANYKLAEDGTTHQGYTRYGAWYGNEYGDWSSMFAAFCLHYAGIGKADVPVNSGILAWIADLRNEGLYQETGSFSPSSGDIAFLDLDGDGSADHAGIVTDNRDGNLSLVVGDDNGTVAGENLSSGDSRLTGGFKLPENPSLAEEETLEASGDSTEEAVSYSDAEENRPAADDGEETLNGVLSREGAQKLPDRYVESVAGSGTSYDAGTKVLTTELTLNLSFRTAELESCRYIYTYPEGVIIPDGVLNVEYTLSDSDGKKAGTYLFQKNADGTYSTIIGLEESYVQSSYQSKPEGTIDAYVWFKGALNTDGIQEDGSWKSLGSDETALVIPKAEITYPDNDNGRYDISTTKKSSVNKADGKLTYTVEVSSNKGTPGDISFTDTIRAEGMSLGTPEVTVQKRNNTTWTRTDVSVATSYDNGTLTMSLPGLRGSEETYEVTYTYDISDFEGDISTAGNRVLASSKNDKGTEVKHESTANVEINNTHSLTKYGSYEAQNGQIRWEITVNANQTDLAGSRLTDDMLGQLKKGTDLTISPENGYTLEKDENGSITGITFDALENGKNTGKYTIVYYTEETADFDDRTVTNTARLEPGDGSEAIEAPSTVTVSGGKIEKSAGEASVDTAAQTALVPWTVSLTLPESGLPKGTVIRDDTLSDPWGGKNGTHYLTRKQVLDWINGFGWADENGESKGKPAAESLFDIVFRTMDGTAYTLSEIKSNADGSFDEARFTGFELTAKENIALPEGALKLVISYQTTADLTEAAGTEGKTYRNTVWAGDKSAHADYTYKKGFIKTDGDNRTEATQITNATGKLTWKLRATLGKNSSQIVYKDTLPTGIELESVYVDSMQKTLTPSEDGSISGDNGYYEVSGSCQDGVLTLNLHLTEAQAGNGQKLWKGQSYIVTLNCRVNKEALEDYTEGIPYTFENTASAEDDDGSIGSDTQTQEWTEEKSSTETRVVDKSGSWDNATRRVNYTVTLNPEGKDILEGSDQLNLTDVLKYSKKLEAYNNQTKTTETFEVSGWILPTTVRLYEAVYEKGELIKGDEITTFNWKVETSEEESWPYKNVSTMTASGIPDETPLILEYAYQFYTGVPSSGYTVQNDLGITNSVRLDGTAEGDSKNQSDAKWSEQDHAGGVTTSMTYTIYKVDAVDYSKLLEGAAFKLQHYEEGSYVDDDFTYRSDKNGIIVVRYQSKDDDQPRYSLNTLYRLVETEAPENYNLPDDPEAEALYFYFGSSDTTVNNLPDTLPANTHDLNKSSLSAFVSNEAQKTEITVDKKWFRKDGTPDEDHEGEITFGLYKTTKVAEAVLKGTLSPNGWTQKDIGSGTYTAGTGVTYTIAYRATDSNKVTAPVIYLNGNAVDCTESYASDTNTYTFVYHFTLASGENVLSGGNLTVNDWGVGSLWTVPDQAEFTVPTAEDECVGTYTLSSECGWTQTITDLPANEITDGVKNYYTYYVKEAEVADCETTYDNNGGIGRGLITIKNKSLIDKAYELPKSGGGGTLLYTLGGVLMILMATIYGTFISRRRKEGRRKG